MSRKNVGNGRDMVFHQYPIIISIKRIIFLQLFFALTFVIKKFDDYYMSWEWDGVVEEKWRFWSHRKEFEILNWNLRRYSKQVQSATIAESATKSIFHLPRELHRYTSLWRHSAPQWSPFHYNYRQSKNLAYPNFPLILFVLKLDCEYHDRYVCKKN